MKEATSKNCQHFRQHYIKFWEGRFDPIRCGHCVYPRIQHRTTDTLACVYLSNQKSRKHDPSGG